MTYVVYTDNESIEKVDGIAYRALAPFYGVVTGASGVFIDGESESILSAYEAANVTILDELPTSPMPPARGVDVGWDDIRDKPSLLAIGTTASTAAAGNHNHAITAHTASGLVAAANIQAGFQAMSTRVKALEDAPQE